MIAEAPAERGQVQRLVRDAGADAARRQRVAERRAGELDAVERQQHAEHVPGLAVVAASGRGGSTQAGSVRQAREVALDERAPPGEKRRQPRELARRRCAH